MTLSRPKDMRAPMQRSDADFWPMTIILTVVVVGILVALAKLAGIV